MFEFDDDEPFFALADPSLNFMTKAGMTSDHMVMQNSGSKWIAARDPIDLSMSMPGDEIVPSGLERQRSLEELGAETLPDQEIEILEGVFHRTSVGTWLSSERSELQMRSLWGSPLRLTSLSDFPRICMAAARLAVGWWIKTSGTRT